MERYVRILNKDKESDVIKSVDCFPASSIERIWFDFIEDENHKRFYHIKILTKAVGFCVHVSRSKDECYDTFNRFYSWLLDDKSNEFVFTVDRKEINDCFKNCYF